MKKKLLFLTYVLFCVVNVSAQAVLMPQKSKNVGRETTLGIKFGTSFSKMIYNMSEFKEVGQIFNVKPSFGVNVDYNINEIISIAPEILYSSNGVYHKDYIYRNTYEASYRLIANYLNFRIPVMFKMNMTKYFQPYFFVSPEFSSCIGGSLDYRLRKIGEETYVYDKVKGEITAGDIKQFDVSALVGIGVRFRVNVGHTFFIAKFDVAYNYSFINNYGTAVNGISKEMGKRYNNSIDCMMTIGFPLKLGRSRPCVDFGSSSDFWF